MKCCSQTTNSWQSKRNMTNNEYLYQPRTTVLNPLLAPCGTLPEPEKGYDFGLQIEFFVPRG